MIPLACLNVIGFNHYASYFTPTAGSDEYPLTTTYGGKNVQMDFLLSDYFIMSEKPTYEELEQWTW
jgi:hypothetical protein